MKKEKQNLLKNKEYKEYKETFIRNKNIHLALLIVMCFFCFITFIIGIVYLLLFFKSLL
jgi:hypothetical protein